MGVEIPKIWRDEFLSTREIPSRGLCVVQRFIYTCGLLVNVRLDDYTYDYDARYCYPIGADALVALRDWDGTNDPPGEWVKEKVSERVRGAAG